MQLIDATGMYDKMPKSIGSKRRMLSPDHITEITRLFAGFEESKHSKIFRTTDFFYRTITVERPLRLNYALTEARVEKALASRALSRTPDNVRDALPLALRPATNGLVWTHRSDFREHVRSVLAAAEIALLPATLNALVSELGEPDDEASS